MLPTSYIGPSALKSSRKDKPMLGGRVKVLAVLARGIVI